MKKKDFKIKKNKWSKNPKDEKKPTEEKVVSDDKQSLAEQLKKSQKELLYLKAEFENYKKQEVKKHLEQIRNAGESFIQSLVENGLDDLERALDLSKDDQSFEELKQGLLLIHKKLNETLSRFGVEIIDPTGRPFDPTYQEALSREKTSKVPEGHVTITFKKAYKLHGKVIRPAQVIVAEKPSEDS